MDRPCVQVKFSSACFLYLVVCNDPKLALQQLDDQNGKDAAAVYQHPAFKIDEGELNKLLDESEKVEEILGAEDFAPGSLVCFAICWILFFQGSASFQEVLERVDL